MDPTAREPPEKWSSISVQREFTLDSGTTIRLQRIPEEFARPQVKRFPRRPHEQIFYQAPQDPSNGKVRVELLADAARPVHLLACHLLHHHAGGVGHHVLPGH